MSKDGITNWTSTGLAVLAGQPDDVNTPANSNSNWLRYTDGTVNVWHNMERVGVVVENGHPTHFTFAVTDVNKNVTGSVRAGARSWLSRSMACNSIATTATRLPATKSRPAGTRAAPAAMAATAGTRVPVYGGRTGTGGASGIGGTDAVGAEAVRARCGEQQRLGWRQRWCPSQRRPNRGPAGVLKVPAAQPRVRVAAATAEGVVLKAVAAKPGPVGLLRVPAVQPRVRAAAQTAAQGRLGSGAAGGNVGASGGSAAGGAAGGTGGSAGQNSTGCSCSLGNTTSTEHWTIGLLLGLGLLARRRNGRG